MEQTINAMRHVAIHDPAKYADKRIALIGVGTIGSNLALLLARMQVPMILYDHDTVEEHNLATQTYGKEDIGKTKVEAVGAQIGLIDIGAKLHTVDSIFTMKDFNADIVVSAVDSLDARKMIALQLIEADVEVPIIDGRVGAEQLEVYYFDNAREWLKQIPEEGDTDPCGARFTAYTAVMAAGFMANYIKKFLMGQKITAKRIIFDAASLTYIKE